MIQISLRVLEFMDAVPVSGADVELELRVVQRVIKKVSPSSKPDLTIGQIKVFKGMGTTNSLGQISKTFNVSQTFDELGEANVPSSASLADVVAVAAARLDVAGLRRNVTFGDLTIKEGKHLLGRNSHFEGVIAADFAKSIVGHTTTDSCVLWFCLHAVQLSNRQYFCQILKGSEEVQKLIVNFDSTTANTLAIRIGGLESNTVYEYRLIIEGDTAPQSRVLTRGKFKTFLHELDESGSCLPRAICRLRHGSNVGKRFRCARITT